MSDVPGYLGLISGSVAPLLDRTIGVQNMGYYIHGYYLGYLGMVHILPRHGSSNQHLSARQAVHLWKVEREVVLFHENK